MARPMRTCRDPRKALGQAKALSSPIPRTQSYNLVACTSYDAQADGWIFSDFMAACMLLKDRNVNGDFYSCFPVKEHFQFLASQPSAMNSIKFGYFGNKRADALYEYTRDQFHKGDIWWSPVRREEIRRRIENWVSQKAKAAKCGDVVNIILLGHGDPKRGLDSGGDFLHHEVLAQQTAHFRSAVQVNFILDFCYSGVFKNALQDLGRRECHVSTSADADNQSWSHNQSGSGRYRNGRFMTALVESFTTTPQITIQDLETYIYNRLTCNRSPQAPLSAPQFYSGNSVKSTDSVKGLFFRDMINLSSHGRFSAAHRKRVEWPTTNQTIRRRLGNTAGLHFKKPFTAVSKVVKDEIELCDVKFGYPPDMGVYSQLSSAAPDWRGLIRNLYWRARRQSTIWNIYLLLFERGFIDLNALVTPIELFSISKKNRHCRLHTRVLFECFPRCHSDIKEKDCIARLATIIVRGGRNYLELFQTIIDSGHLGTIDACGSIALKSLHLDLDRHHNLQERKATWTPDENIRPNRNVFGFWLPHGLSVQEARHLTNSGHGDCLIRFEEIERIFYETEGIDEASLSDGSSEEEVDPEATIDNLEEPPGDFISACLASEDDIIPSCFHDLM
ncbi:hypothetical protein N7494_007158 [Penicillium frequentans]|uniref:Uncharacterized protein n=1 Tax=Penicillium frequentans TaxID=3151616 RepID=A0AAD6CRX9_9EURO|nr:hypothetical protein N7494_007158 [Penicillium glabrum]